MLWWMVFLLAVWSIVVDDLAMLPVAVFAGSFCAQTHIPYAGLVGGMGAFTVVAVGVWFWPRRHDAEARRRLLVWGVPSVVLLGVLWTPPVIDQIIHHPGNFSIIKENFSHPTEPAVGFGQAVKVALGNLDVYTLVTGYQGSETALAGVSLPGIALLALWLGAAVVAWRKGYHQVLRLHLVVAAALVLGLISVSRILGFLWYYLVLWDWGTLTLSVVAIVWTAVLLWHDREADRAATATTTDRGGNGADGATEAVPAAPATPVARSRSVTLATAALGALLVATVASFTYDAAHTEVPAASESRVLRHIAPVVVDKLRSGQVPGGGEDGRYLVRWDEDALAIGSQGYGFLLELERQGFDVGVPAAHATGAVPHRVRDPKDATATISYVIGQSNIDRWRSDRNAVEIAFFEPRNADQLRRFDELHDDAVARLQAAGLDDQVPVLDDKLFLVGINPDVPSRVADDVGHMMDLGLPTAVFVAPS
jgi:hypothetical protein